MNIYNKIGWVFFGLTFLVFGSMGIFAWIAGAKALLIHINIFFYLGIACMIIMFLLFIIPDIIMFFPSKKLKNGPLVKGTLVSVSQTGEEINHQPVLEFTVSFTTTDGMKVTAVTRNMISLLDLGNIKTGIEIPIRYNPENPNKIMIDKKMI